MIRRSQKTCKLVFAARAKSGILFIDTQGGGDKIKQALSKVYENDVQTKIILPYEWDDNYYSPIIFIENVRNLYHVIPFFKTSDESIITSLNMANSEEYSDIKELRERIGTKVIAVKNERDSAKEWQPGSNMLVSSIIKYIENSEIKCPKTKRGKDAKSQFQSARAFFTHFTAMANVRQLSDSSPLDEIRLIVISLDLR